MLHVRPEQPSDYAAVRRVNEDAFGEATEADLVDALRAAARPAVSLVAEQDGQVIGHIFFSPVEVVGAGGRFTAMGLAPMAVLPAHQLQGIGSALVRAGLEACLALGHDVVFVLGHPDYYPRFGFAPTAAYGIRCTYDAPPEAFMVAELRPGALAGRTGVVHFRPEFDEA